MKQWSRCISICQRGLSGLYLRHKESLILRCLSEQSCLIQMRHF